MNSETKGRCPHGFNVDGGQRCGQCGMQAALAPRYVLIGWVARHKKRWLFTENADQKDEWERSGLDVVGSFVQKG